MNYDWLSIHEVIKKGKNLETETSYNDWWDIDEYDYDEKAEKVNGISCLYEDHNFEKLLNGIAYEEVNGKVKYYSRYKNGVIDGENVLFYNTGEIKAYAVYKNGILDGEYISFYKDGSYQLRYYEKNFFILVMAVYDTNGNEYIVFKNKNIKNCTKGTYEEIIKDIDKNFSDTLQKIGITDDDFELLDVVDREASLKCLKKYNPIQAKKINRPYCPSAFDVGTDISIYYCCYGHYREINKKEVGRRMNGYVYCRDINNPVDIVNMKNGYMNGEAMNYNWCFFPGKLVEFVNHKYNQLHGVSVFFNNYGELESFKYWLCDRLIIACNFDEDGNIIIFDGDGNIMKTEPDGIQFDNINHYLKNKIKSIKEDVTFSKVYSRQIEINAKKEEDSDYKIYFPF